MQVTFRSALRDDVPDVLALLRDDDYGAERETDPVQTYLDAFDQMQDEGDNKLIVGHDPAGRLVATYQ